MPGNHFGHTFVVTTFGESHGPALGCIVDGCPPGLALSEVDIQFELERRRTGQSKFTSQRQEGDKVQILSGVFEGNTTGTPIGLLIWNEDAKSKDYDDIKDLFRPGHADFTYHHKYGIRDYRGSGRAYAREARLYFRRRHCARSQRRCGKGPRASVEKNGRCATENRRGNMKGISYMVCSISYTRYKIQDTKYVSNAL